MKRLSIIIVLLLIPVFQLFAQRSNVLAVFQLVENGKYDEAKKAIDAAIEDEKTKDWYRTWYAKGFLCQKAYEKGIADKDKKKYELYPDQIFLAYESFEKAIALNKTARLMEQLEPLYVLLANDFLKLGQQHYNAKDYKNSLKAYEHAMLINRSEVLSANLDTNLVYNTALAAFMLPDYGKAASYLNKLNEMDFSPNIPHLLYSVNLAQGDTSLAEKALVEGISKYDSVENLVLILAELRYKRNNLEGAINALDSAMYADTISYILPYTKGLIYQKAEKYFDAIDAYEVAIKLDTSQIDPYANIGTCYFNIGVEMEEFARTITNSRKYQEEKAKSIEARKSAINWLELVYKKDPEHQEAKEQLAQLYQALHMVDKLKGLK